MALGRRREQFQQDLMVPTSALPRSPGHPFYAALNRLLAEAKFDAYVEGLCEPLYREGGRAVSGNLAEPIWVRIRWFDDDAERWVSVGLGRVGKPVAGIAAVDHPVPRRLGRQAVCR